METKKSDLNGETVLRTKPAYICIMRYFCSAWVTPMLYPIGEVTVKYAGVVKESILTEWDWNGHELDMRTKMENGVFLCAGFYENEPIMGFEVEEKNKLYKCDIMITDTIEWWGVIVSDTPVRAADYLPGFRENGDGKTFTSIADEEECEKRLSVFDDIIL